MCSSLPKVRYLRKLTVDDSTDYPAQHRSDVDGSLPVLSHEDADRTSCQDSVGTVSLQRPCWPVGDGGQTRRACHFAAWQYRRPMAARLWPAGNIGDPASSLSPASCLLSCAPLLAPEAFELFILVEITSRCSLIAPCPIDVPHGRRCRHDMRI
jgi:hypothetical protein